jgi:hypothetical protein
VEFQALILDIIQENHELNNKVMVLEADGERKDHAIKNFKADGERKDHTTKDLQEDGERKDHAIKDLEIDRKHKDQAIVNAKRRWRIAHNEKCSLQRDNRKLSAAAEESAALRGDIKKACKASKMVSQLKKTVQEKLLNAKLYTWHLGLEKNKFKSEMEAQNKKHTSEVQNLRLKLTDKQSNIEELKFKLKLAKDKADTSNKELAVKDSEIEKLQAQIVASRHVGVEYAILAKALKKDKVRDIRKRQALQGKLKRKTRQIVYLRSDAYPSKVVLEKELVMDSLCREHELRLHEVEQQRQDQMEAKDRAIDQLTKRENHLLFRLEGIEGAPVTVPQLATTASPSDQSTTACPDVDMSDAGYDSGYDTDDGIL